MDSKSREQLAEILKKEPAALTAGDKEFLRARQSYLTPQQLELYVDSFKPKKASEKPLEDLSDKDLGKLAKSLDLDPSDFADRDALTEAVREKQAASK